MPGLPVAGLEGLAWRPGTAATMTMDAAGVITAWSDGAEQLLGYSEYEIVGHQGSLLFQAEDRTAGVPEAERHAALMAGYAAAERYHLRRDGSRFWGLALTMPAAGTAGSFWKAVFDYSRQKRTEDQLRQDEAHYRGLATGLPQLVFRTAATGHRIWGSPQWEVYTGLSHSDSVEFGWLQAIHPDDVVDTLAAWTRAQAQGEYYFEHRILGASDSEYRWHQTRAVPAVTLGAGTEWVGSSTDIHDIRMLQQRLAGAEQRLRRLVEGMPQLVWRSCSLGDWTWASPQWLRYTGQSQAETRGQGWLAAVHPDDHGTVTEAWEGARPHGELDVEFRVHRIADDTYIWHHTRSVPVRDAQGGILEWLGTTTDIQDLKQLQQQQQHLLDAARRHAAELEAEVRHRQRAEAQLSYAAYHDDLTKLRNRAYFMQQLQQVLRTAQSRTSDQTPRSAVLFLDLDRFKLVNDSLGHQAGDRLLVEAARRLEACTAPADTLARLGGDEFALLVPDADSMAPVAALADCIIDSLRQPLWIGTQEVFTSCSIGIVQAGAHHSTPEALLGDADIAMYHAKRHAAGGYAVFNEAMRGSAADGLILRTDLRNAVARQEFHLLYQPICNPATSAITGVEALIRWQHPRRGLVSPADFIPAAEETGLIREIGAWVVRNACGQLLDWRRRFPDLALRLSINASGEELKDAGFAAQVQDALNNAGLDPASLQLEVTESVFLQQPDAVGEVLAGLRRLGVRIALDDFGTGYSSLSYMDRYEIDAVKIDRSFVARMLTQPKAVAIVDAVVQLGRAMGLDVIAEGVEDVRQMDLLRSAGCGFVQGYLLGRPMPPAALTERLEHQIGQKRA